MIFTPVDSTMLARIAYDAMGQTLYVEFRDHSLYRYDAVPMSVYGELANAPSKGPYFNRAIREKFQYQRLPHLASLDPSKQVFLS